METGEKNPLNLLCFQGGKKEILCFVISIRLLSKPGLSNETILSLSIISNINLTLHKISNLLRSLTFQQLTSSTQITFKSKIWKLFCFQTKFNIPRLLT